MSIETGMPEVPRYAMYTGCVCDQLSWQMARSGLLTATARLVAQGGRYGLVKEGTRQAVEVPAGIHEQMAWVLARERFTKRELAVAFPGEVATKIDRLLIDLKRMALVESTL